MTAADTTGGTPTGVTHEPPRPSCLACGGEVTPPYTSGCVPCLDKGLNGRRLTQEQIDELTRLFAVEAVAS